MSNPWPERRHITYGIDSRSYESDEEYIVYMLQQLFVEIAQVKAMLEKPLYQINVPPMDEMMSTVPLHPLTRSMYGSFAVYDGDTNDRDAKRQPTRSLEDAP